MLRPVSELQKAFNIISILWHGYLWHVWKDITIELFHSAVFFFLELTNRWQRVKVENALLIFHSVHKALHKVLYWGRLCLCFLTQRVVVPVENSGVATIVENTRSLKGTRNPIACLLCVDSRKIYVNVSLAKLDF